MAKNTKAVTGKDCNFLVYLNMKKQKEIKVVFFLAFLFLLSFCFAQNVSKKDSLLPYLKKNPRIFKYGLNYLPDTKVSGKNFGRSLYGGYSNPNIHVYEQAPLEILGPYLGFGRVRKDSGFFSMYYGLYYTNARASFHYVQTSGTHLDPVLPIYRVRVNEANGFLILNTIGVELNFHIDVNRSRIIISPFNPSFTFFNHIITQKSSYEFDAIRTYNSGQSDSPISPNTKVEGDFNVNISSMGSLGVSSPISLGFEQRMPMKKRTLIVGLKASILLKGSFGGQLFSGFEF